MSAIRKEIQNYIDIIPDNKLEALMPILNLLIDETVVIETNLSAEEKAIIMQGREAYKKGDYVSLDELQ